MTRPLEHLKIFKVEKEDCIRKVPLKKQDLMTINGTELNYVLTTFLAQTTASQTAKNL